jgi:ribosomal peptide maturation radical SAM protein 1
MATPAARPDTAAGPPAGVLLVCMPWATTIRPSLALGILARHCERQDVPVQTLYPNLDLAALVGLDVADAFANDRNLFGLSEHLFACDIFGADRLRSEELLGIVTGLGLPAPFDDAGYLRRLRDEVVPAFLDRAERRVLAHQPTVVGFTATFNQVLASLAMGRRLKRARPALTVLYGGACFDGEMGPEYHRALPEAVDHVFVGEADTAFTEFLNRWRRGRPAAGIPGVTWRDGDRVRLLPGRPLADMNDGPMPDFDGFFMEVDRVRQATGAPVTVTELPFESSRGCWWGQREQCVFCGINPDVMSFREKDTGRVIEEILALSRRHRVVRFTAADWIVGKQSRRALFTGLRDLGLDLTCFYETRADLSKEEIALMRVAGVDSVQPGIESLSTELLVLMRKQTSRIRHVQFLRWCAEYGIEVSYNLLGGFPGERAEWYLDMAEFIPRVVHLPPPSSNLHFVELHRFSPLFELKDHFGIRDYRIRRDYAFTIPPELADPLKFGYFFDYRSDRLAPRDAYAGAVTAAIAPWIGAHAAGRPPVYTYRLGPGFTEVTDTRRGDSRVLTLTGLHHDVVLLCDRIRPVGALRRLLARRWPRIDAGSLLDRVLDQLADRDLIMREGDLVLTLPIGHRPRATADLERHVLGTESDPAEPAASGR